MYLAYADSRQSIDNQLYKLRLPTYHTKQAGYDYTKKCKDIGTVAHTPKTRRVIALLRHARYTLPKRPFYKPKRAFSACKTGTFARQLRIVRQHAVYQQIAKTIENSKKHQIMCSTAKLSSQHLRPETESQDGGLYAKKQKKEAAYGWATSFKSCF